MKTGLNLNSWKWRGYENSDNLGTNTYLRCERMKNASGVKNGYYLSHLLEDYM